ncbi:pyruvate kinase [Stutzerimonas nosocomialis]|uniref:pyruvate kinase n=1 Tax=Stutzerimonas nosocomialis TaxID=1056496 RepID=UPI001F502C35|nr:pyruvate kinase [Stutzerimonas nosocomialis]
MKTPDHQRERTGSANSVRDVSSTLKYLGTLREEMLDSIAGSQSRLDSLDPSYRDSARNLLAYLTLRRHDIRPVQMRLADMGLSSLGRSEAHILSSVTAVIDVLERLQGSAAASSGADASDVEAPDLKRSRELLDAHAQALFGSPPDDRDVRIMVTMPSEAADNYSLIRDLVAANMDAIRINCAHDGPDVWLRMIEHLRRAEKELGRSCKVMMDLAGPKLRTGAIEAGPAVIKAKPVRNALGQVVEPARIWLTDSARPAPPPSAADAALPVDGDWLARLEDGECIRFKDARDSRRQMTVIERNEQGCWAQADKTAYFVPGLKLKAQAGSASIAPFPAAPQKIRLQEDDLLLLTDRPDGGRGATFDSVGKLLSPASIGCTLPEVFADVRTGELVWFDDGKIGGVIESIEPHTLKVRITHAPGGANLQSDKGINFPQSELSVGALGPQDLEALAFAAKHADVVEMSFVNTAADVHGLLAELERLGAERLGVVLKIETRKGFECLPALLLEGMRRPRFGVMIARGDLAVEEGFERMAELQEEILCLCEAAHVPVIWATQVLESLAKKGAPSRAEITDAATGVRADCVMLNKGPHILKAVATLNDLLTRMRAHHDKKRQMLRRLAVASHPVFEDEGDV